MPNYEVVLKKVEPVRVVEVRGVIPSMEVINTAFNRLFDQTSGYLAQHGGKFAGPGIALYYDAEMRDRDLNVGAAMPVAGDIKGDEQAQVYELPGFATVAAVVHHGSFDGLNLAYKAVMDWIEGNGYKIVGPNREVYLEYERESDPAKYVTEVQFPVAKM